MAVSVMLLIIEGIIRHELFDFNREVTAIVIPVFLSRVLLRSMFCSLTSRSKNHNRKYSFSESLPVCFH